MKCSGTEEWKGQTRLTAERLDPCFSVLLQPADLSPQLKLHWKEKKEMKTNQYVLLQRESCLNSRLTQLRLKSHQSQHFVQHNESAFYFMRRFFKFQAINVHLYTYSVRVVDVQFKREKFDILGNKPIHFTGGKFNEKTEEIRLMSVKYETAASGINTGNERKQLAWLCQLSLALQTFLCSCVGLRLHCFRSLSLLSKCRKAPREFSVHYPLSTKQHTAKVSD